MNTITNEYGLTLDLPDEISVCPNDDFIRLADRINEKQKLLEQIQISKSQELTFELYYLHKCNDLQESRAVLRNPLQDKAVSGWNHRCNGGNAHQVQ